MLSPNTGRDFISNFFHYFKFRSRHFGRSTLFNVASRPCINNLFLRPPAGPLNLSFPGLPTFPDEIACRRTQTASCKRDSPYSRVSCLSELCYRNHFIEHTKRNKISFFCYSPTPFASLFGAVAADVPRLVTVVADGVRAGLTGMIGRYLLVGARAPHRFQTSTPPPTSARCPPAALETSPATRRCVDRAVVPRSSSSPPTGESPRLVCRRSVLERRELRLIAVSPGVTSGGKPMY